MSATPKSTAPKAAPTNKPEASKNANTSTTEGSKAGNDATPSHDQPTSDSATAVPKERRKRSPNVAPEIRLAQLKAEEKKIEEKIARRKYEQIMAKDPDAARLVDELSVLKRAQGILGARQLPGVEQGLLVIQAEIDKAMARLKASESGVASPEVAAA